MREELDVIRRVMDHISNDNFDPDDANQTWLNEKHTKIFKLVIDEFGIEEVANMITDHPNKGYMVRYLDDFAPRMIAERHKNNINEAKLKLQELYDRACQ